MSEQGTSQQPANEERSSSANQQERARPGGGSGGERGERSRRRHRRPGHNAPPPPQRAESSLNIEELRELMELFTEHGLTEFELEREEFRIHLGRNPAPQASAQAQGAMMAPLVSAHGSPPPVQSPAAGAHGGSGVAGAQGQAAPSSSHAGGAESAEGGAAAADEGEDLHIITSPIVGTFYRSPSPTAEPFVRIGSRVESDSIVCIIEAMKLMNEIQAETSGEVVKIYVENGQPVEYGQPLFGIRK